MTEKEHLQLKALLEAGDVQRLHTKPTVQPYRVADHTWRMLVLLRALHDAPSLALVWAVLTHDCAELFVGDVPRTAKWANPQLGKAMKEAEGLVHLGLGTYPMLTQEEERWLAGLDLLELLLFCEQQLCMHRDQRYQDIINTCKRNLLQSGKYPAPIEAYTQTHVIQPVSSRDVLGWNW